MTRIREEEERQETPDFVVSKLWPANSLNLNPVYITRFGLCSVESTRDKSMKRWLIDVWCSLEQSIFDEAVDKWRGRLRACVLAKRRHFEFSL